MVADITGGMSSVVHIQHVLFFCSPDTGQLVRVWASWFVCLQIVYGILHGLNLAAAVIRYVEAKFFFY